MLMLMLIFRARVASEETYDRQKFNTNQDAGMTIKEEYWRSSVHCKKLVIWITISYQKWSFKTPEEEFRRVFGYQWCFKTPNSCSGVSTLLKSRKLVFWITIVDKWSFETRKVFQITIEFQNTTLRVEWITWITN